MLFILYTYFNHNNILVYKEKKPIEILFNTHKSLIKYEIPKKNVSILKINFFHLTSSSNKLLTHLTA